MGVAALLRLKNKVILIFLPLPINYTSNLFYTFSDLWLYIPLKLLKRTLLVFHICDIFHFYFKMWPNSSATCITHDHWRQTGLNSKGAPIYRTSGRNTKSEAHICMISGQGIKTTGARAPVAPHSLAPLIVNNPWMPHSGPQVFSGPKIQGFVVNSGEKPHPRIFFAPKSQNPTYLPGLLS